MPYLPFELSPRVALAAPANHDQDVVQSTALLVSSILAALGAAWIMSSFMIFKSLRSFRHQLILGLAISDLLMALNFSASAGMNVSGNYISEPAQKAFCDFNGFMTQVFVIQTDYWVLTIAVCTYFILADHKHASAWVQDRRYLLFAIPWVFSCLWAGVGLGTAGYGNIGGWCWFTSDQVRLLANFVPRWIIIAAMLGLYARLYWVLYKAHNRFLSFGSTSDAQTGSRSRDLTSGAVSGSNEETRRQLRNTRRLKKLAKMMLLYPFAYMLVWILPTSVRVYQAIKHEPAPFALQTVDKGLVDALIYGANESSMSSWRNVLWPSRFPVQTDGTGPDNGYGGSGDRDLEMKKPDRIRASRIHAGTNSAYDSTSDSVSSLDVDVTPRTYAAAATTRNNIEMSDFKGLGRAASVRGGGSGVGLGSGNNGVGRSSSGSEERIMPVQEQSPQLQHRDTSMLPPQFQLGQINIRKTVEVEVIEHDVQAGGPVPPLQGPRIHATSPPVVHKKTFLRD
ncbi:hypothetical protein MKZ38_004874 [Zalerion maritima]|uniref:G-protein coupled receptors family 2 profile 2 domain-containing protein n=1 Tax=Zalerion maritima TaxID=339359 RepID=A0AAD5RL09_9PEZI|nr:hypothetical protein MKZ38_004874 [Zalerion maritima]